MDCGEHRRFGGDASLRITAYSNHYDSPHIACEENSSYREYALIIPQSGDARRSPRCRLYRVVGSVNRQPYRRFLTDWRSFLSVYLAGLFDEFLIRRTEPTDGDLHRLLVDEQAGLAIADDGG